MSMRRKGASNATKHGALQVESGADPINSTGQDPPCRRRKLTKHRWLALVKIVVLGLATLVALDLIYLSIEAIRFGSPCLIAQNVKHKLESSPRDPNVPAPPLPKIIHQQWKTKTIPEGVFTTYNNEWKKLYPSPEYQHMLWTDESGRHLIAEEFSWFLEAYDSYAMNIQRADSMRYFILYKYGGVYADLDYEPFMNFWEALPNDRVSFIESPYKINEQVQNSLMSSPARDPFWNVTFDILYARRNSQKVLSSTGPSAMDAAIAAAGPKDPVHMLPCENFHRIPLSQAGKNSPLLTQFARTFMAYSPLSKTCGDWSRRDDCHFGLHHNSVSYISNMGGNWVTTLFKF